MPKQSPKRLKVLIVPDKFKGTLTSEAAAQAIAKGWHQERPQDHIRTLPLTDGGDGFGDCLRLLLNAKQHSCRSINAAHQPCKVPWWETPNKKVTIVESARCIGLAMLPPNHYHPFDLDTRGLATLLLACTNHQPETCLIGIGGSATNDGGFGLAKGLGWSFIANDGSSIERWTDLARLKTIHPPTEPSLPKSTNLVVATDVQNPLLGPLGATRIYGPQKGIRPEDIKPANQALGQLSRVIAKQLDRNLAAEPGAGAAGGLGFGLMAFANATITPGTDIYASYSHLQSHLNWADLVVTGEGRIDASSLMGKGVGEIARQAAKRSLPCVGVGGSILNRNQLVTHFDTLQAITPNLTHLEEAQKKPRQWLRLAARQAARSWTPPAQ